MGLYARFFAFTYDRMLEGVERAGLQERRRALLSRASGRTLEIGAGTGANLELYPQAVTELVLAEPEEPMAIRLDRHCARVGRPAEIVRAGAESLPFDDDSFDTVVSTLVLCTVGDLDRSLGEAGRVLRPGGQLLFLEHIRSEDPRLARWQDRLNPIQQRIACGCNCNRDTPGSIERAGFDLELFERGQLPKAPKHIRPFVCGSAVPRTSGQPAA